MLQQIGVFNAEKTDFYNVNAAFTRDSFMAGDNSLCRNITIGMVGAVCGSRLDGRFPPQRSAAPCGAVQSCGWLWKTEYNVGEQADNKQRAARHVRRSCCTCTLTAATELQ